jgi:flagellar protein FliL
MPESVNPASFTAATSSAPTKPVIVTANKSSAGMMAVIVFLAVTAGVGGAWFFLKPSHTNRTVTVSSDGDSSPGVVHLEGFTVNLADSEENHFLRVTMYLAVDHLPAGVDGEKPVSGLPIARIRDSILGVLTVCKADALLTPDGKTQLKKKLLEALNRDLPDLGVRDIYFTEFLVQR